jgi:hypothetical protein
MAIKRHLEMLKQESSGVLGGWAPPVYSKSEKAANKRTNTYCPEMLLSPARTRKLLQQMVETRLEQLIQTRT